MKWLPLVTSALLCSRAATTFAAPTAVPATDPPNIVFILADDLGYGDLGCYGQKRIRTPELDRMAREGMRWTQFYAGSTVCAPSRCVLMTGQHTGHCYIRGNARHDLRPQDRTVAEVLRQRGYVTGLIGKWGLGGFDAGTGHPNRKGFDFFFGYLDQVHAHNYYPSFLVRQSETIRLPNEVPNEGRWGQGVATRRLAYSHDLFTQEALAFIERHRNRPFFLYLAYTIPHANNEAGSHGMEVPDLGAYARTDWPEQEKAFAAMVTRLDRDVGRLRAKLQELDLDRRTVLFFSSDNGPHREGGHDPNFFQSSGGLRGIKRDLYEGGIRVPLIVCWPGHVPAGVVCPTLGWFADFLPTAAELAGAPVSHPVDGISLVPTLLGQPGQKERAAPLYWEFYEGTTAQALRLGNYKAVCRPMWGAIELYDLSRDSAEKHDIAQEHPQLVQRLRDLMRQAHEPSPLDWRPRRAVPARR